MAGPSQAIMDRAAVVPIANDDVDAACTKVKTLAIDLDAKLAKTTDENNSGEANGADEDFSFPSIVDEYFPDVPANLRKKPRVSEPQDEVSVCLSGQELDQVPHNLVETYSSTLTHLDLRNNSLSNVGKLAQFFCLRSVLLDDNELTDVLVPCLENVEVLSIRRNKIEHWPSLVDHLKNACPRLKDLCVSANDDADCHDDDTGIADYAKIRLYILHKFPLLERLDGGEIFAEERQKASKHGRYVGRVARPHPNEYRRTSSTAGSAPPITPVSPRALSKSASFFGTARYQYDGRDSEGNRYIFNNDL